MKWHRYFKYNPKTGRLIWKQRPLSDFATERAWAAINSRFAGREAGCLSTDGYVRICVGGKMYRAARIVFEMHRGQLGPDEFVDHIDMVTTNDRIKNLRKCSNSENLMNRGIPSHNTSGLKGASYDKTRERWQSYITVARKRIPLGRYDTREEAHAAYCQAAKVHHGKFARTQ